MKFKIILSESKKNKHNNNNNNNNSPATPPPERPVIESTQYKKDIKTVQKYPNFKIDFYEEIINKIKKGEALPAKCKTHKQTASGCKYMGYWNTHIYPNIILIYDVKPTQITLIRIGTHNDIGLTESMDSSPMLESKQDQERFVYTLGSDMLEPFLKYKQELAKRFGSNYGDMTWVASHVSREDLLDKIKVCYSNNDKIAQEIEQICKREDADDVTLLLDKDGWKAYKINTPAASVKYGLVVGGRAQWCISGGYEDASDYGGVYKQAVAYFKRYLRERYICYVFVYGPDGSKWALCPIGYKDFDVWDEYDDAVDDSIIPGCPPIQITTRIFYSPDGYFPEEYKEQLAPFVGMALCSAGYGNDASNVELTQSDRETDNGLWRTANYLYNITFCGKQFYLFDRDQFFDFFYTDKVVVELFKKGIYTPFYDITYYGEVGKEFVRTQKIKIGNLSFEELKNKIREMVNCGAFERYSEEYLLKPEIDDFKNILNATSANDVDIITMNAAIYIIADFTRYCTDVPKMIDYVVENNGDITGCINVQRAKDSVIDWEKSYQCKGLKKIRPDLALVIIRFDGTPFYIVDSNVRPSSSER